MVGRDKKEGGRMRGKCYRWVGVLVAILMVMTAVSLAIAQKPKKELLAGSFRKDINGWIYIHVEGEPYKLGYQHGYLLAKEIDQVLRVIKFYFKHTTGKDWDWYRKAAQEQFAPTMPEEYRKEFEGMVAGIKDAGVKGIDYIDLLAWNGWIDLAWYYLPTLGAAESGEEKLVRSGLRSPFPRAARGSCSAFIATGNATRDGRIVMAHNLWYDYLFCVYWNVIEDLKPAKGYRIITQCFPGFIYGGTDFWINGAGLLVTETTITGFKGYDPKGLPNFVRVRKATQYADNIDDWIKIMTTRVNGGYANDWLIGDIKTGEIARLELGLKNYRVWRTFDGYYVGSNIALDPKVRAEETEFDYEKRDSSPYARRSRWLQLMNRYYGQIDVDLAKKFLADHYDASLQKYQPSANTLCGHVEEDPRGLPEWGYGAYYPGGAIDGKVTDSEMAARMKFWAKWGHSCDTDFRAKEFLAKHPEYKWQEPYLKDLLSYPWTVFSIKEYLGR